MDRLLYRLCGIREDRDTGHAIDEYTRRCLKHENEFRVVQTKKTATKWRRKSKSMDAELEATLSTGSGSSTSNTPNSSTIVKQTVKPDQMRDGQTAVTSSQADGLNALPEDVPVGAIVASPGITCISRRFRHRVGEGSAIGGFATGFQTNIPIFATAVVAGGSVKDLTATARPCQ